MLHLNSDCSHLLSMSTLTSVQPHSQNNTSQLTQPVYLQQVEVMVTEVEPEPAPEVVEEVPTPPTEPQVEPIDSIAEV